MNPNEPRVSIGMPVFNGQRFLAGALDSLLNQTFSDFELVISDNGSVDRTEQICRSYADRDNRIRYYRQAENRGAIWNFNHVFTFARGAYFKWSSYDDLCSPTFLERCVELLDADPDVAWCHTQSVKIDQHGALLAKDPDASEQFAGWVHSRQAGLPRKHHDSPRADLRFAGALLGTDWCADSYGLIRADQLRATNLLPNCYGAEKVLMAELSLRGVYREVPETLFFQRVHDAASGNLNSTAAEQSFMDPSQARRFAGTRLRLLEGYVRAIRNSCPAGRTRLRCYTALLRYLFQIKKWGRILRNTLRGAGVGRHNYGGARRESAPPAH